VQDFLKKLDIRKNNESVHVTRYVQLPYRTLPKCNNSVFQQYHSNSVWSYFKNRKGG